MRAGCRSILPVLLCALVACTGGAGDRPALAAINVVITPANLLMAVGAKAGVAVTIAPTAILGATRTRQAFSCGITGVSDTACILSVLEDGGGTIDRAGIYPAPQTTGTFHAMAASRADPSTSPVAAIVVSEKVVSISMSPANVSLQSGQTVQFSAMVTTTCGTFANTSLVTS